MKHALPKTNSRFGRASARDAHWLYKAIGAPASAGAATQFRDPITTQMIVELRHGAGGGTQTMFPPSIWADDPTKEAETVAWETDDDPRQVEFPDLLECSKKIAALSLLSRYWPKDGSKARHHTALVVGSFLARAGWSEPAIEAGMQAILAAAGDTEPRDRKRAAKDALKWFKDGKDAPGFPKLAECFGDKVAKKVAEWLGYGSDDAHDRVGDTEGELPELLIKDSNLPGTAKALAKLIAQKDRFLFNGHAPVRVTVEADCMPRALEVTIEAVRVYAHEICRPVKARKVKDQDTGEEMIERIPITLPKDIAALYLSGLEGQWGLSRLRGITTAPILTADGGIRTATGYDPESELYAINALHELRNFFRTFPFADGEKKFDPGLGVQVVDQDKPIGMDESTFLVALMTAVCRQSLDFAPGFLARAPNISGAGTGKGYLVKAAAIVSSGARPAAFTGGHDKEECEKRITAALTGVQPVIFLDNYNAQEGSPTSSPRRSPKIPVGSARLV
jgi:hypothetical protein